MGVQGEQIEALASLPLVAFIPWSPMNPGTWVEARGILPLPPSPPESTLACRPSAKRNEAQGSTAVEEELAYGLVRAGVRPQRPLLK